MRKRNNLKKIASLGLAALLLLSACGQPAEDPTTGGTTAVSTEKPSKAPDSASESAEPVKLTIAVRQHSNDTLTDVGEKAILQDVEDALGYEIEWISIMETGMTEKVATLLADNSVDVYWGLLSDGQISTNAQMFLTLEDKIEDYCPNVYALYENSVDGWENYLTYPDGHIYGMMGGDLDKYNNMTKSALWINRDWLDAIDKDVPTTFEQFLEVLKAFRDNDMNGDGDPTNEIPLDFCQAFSQSTYHELAHSYGLPSITGRHYSIENGKVISTADTDAFRQFLGDFKSLIDDGLVNKEGLTQTKEQYNANINNGKVGAFWAWYPQTFISDTDLAAKFVPVPAISAEGYSFSTPAMGQTSNRNAWVIAEKCENWEAALKVWDYLSRDQKAAYTCSNGVEGLLWEYVDEVAYTRKYTADEAISFGFDEKLSSLAGTASFKATIAIINVGPLIVDSLRPTEGSVDMVRKEAVDMVQDYLNPAMSKAIVPTELKEEFDFTCEGLNSYIEAFAADSILYGVTDDSWNEHLKKLEEFNYDFYIEYYQKVLDSDF